MSSLIKKPSIWVALLLLWAGHFLVDVMFGIWPVFKSMAKVDLATAGIIVAGGSFVGEGSQLFFGIFSDRGYRKQILIFGVLIATSAAFLIYFSHYGAFFGLYLLTCIGSGAFHPSAAGLVNSLNPYRRGLFMTIFASGGSLGLAFSQILFIHMNDSFPGHSYWLALPALVLGFVLLFYHFPISPITNETSHQVKMSDFITFFKRSDLRSLYISLVTNQILLWGTIFILPDVLKTHGHTDWICMGGGHLCLILGGTIMMIPAGYLADKFSARSVMYYATGLAGIAFYIIIFLGNYSQNLILTSLFILGASLSIVHPIGVSLGARLVPDKPSTISAFLMGMVWCVSEVVGPGGVGWMSTFFTDSAPVKALAILGSCFFINIYSVFSLPNTKRSIAEKTY
ncbi:MAG: MFS transporter [Parachlamydiaceae bacterium]|nr:MFS transporter [Parachlamydiaceae bacterium]